MFTMLIGSHDLVDTFMCNEDVVSHLAFVIVVVHQVKCHLNIYWERNM